MVLYTIKSHSVLSHWIIRFDWVNRLALSVRSKSGTLIKLCHVDLGADSVWRCHTGTPFIKINLSHDLYVYVEHSSTWKESIHFEMGTCFPNSPISQIPQCIRQISHNVPLCERNVHTCIYFFYKMVHCGIWDWCIVGFFQQVFWHGSNTHVWGNIDL